MAAIKCPFKTVSSFLGSLQQNRLTKNRQKAVFILNRLGCTLGHITVQSVTDALF